MRKTLPILLLLLCGQVVLEQNLNIEPISLQFDENYQIPTNDNLIVVLSNKNIIAVGEATHGSKEFIEIRQALFFYLYQHFRYRHILLEIPQSIGLELNEYINGQRTFAYIDSILKPAKTIYSKEFFRFLNECRNHNEENGSGNKICIDGFDIDQYFDLTVNRIKKPYLPFLMIISI